MLRFTDSEQTLELEASLQNKASALGSFLEIAPTPSVRTSSNVPLLLLMVTQRVALRPSLRRLGRRAGWTRNCADFSLSATREPREPTLQKPGRSALEKGFNLSVDRMARVLCCTL